MMEVRIAIRHHRRREGGRESERERVREGERGRERERGRGERGREGEGREGERERDRERERNGIQEDCKKIKQVFLQSNQVEDLTQELNSRKTKLTC
jgi:hypothetical protein